MTISERVARRFADEAEHHQRLLQNFAKLMAGPKISDTRMCALLGITLDKAHMLANELRDQLGITAMVSLRDALRKRH